MTAHDVPVQRWRRGAAWAVDQDGVAREEPLEIRVNGRSIAVVMRSPGHEREHAVGFLLTEGVVRSAEDLLDVLLCRDLPSGQSGNVVDVLLAPRVVVDLERLTRHVFSGSSCGICGKATLDALALAFPPITTRHRVDPNALARWPDRLRAAQPDFDRTGGVHASALIDADDRVVAVREDIGRHNAVDKLLGFAVLEGALPLERHALMLSGRISFELVQKALAAGIGLVAGVGAPSSLALDCAERSGITVVGFVRADRFNVYCHPERVGSPAPVP